MYICLDSNPKLISFNIGSMHDLYCLFSSYASYILTKTVSDIISIFNGPTGFGMFQLEELFFFSFLFSSNFHVRVSALGSSRAYLHSISIDHQKEGKSFDCSLHIWLFSVSAAPLGRCGSAGTTLHSPCREVTAPVLPLISQEWMVVEVGPSTYVRACTVVSYLRMCLITSTSCCLWGFQV